MLAFTHILFAFALSRFAGKNTTAAVLFAVFPEVDILFNQITPFVRNGIFHSILAALVATAVSQAVFSDKKITYGALIGCSSHLLLDILSFERIMLFFPIKSFYSLNLFPTYGLMENLAVISLAVLILMESENPTVSELFSRKVRSVLTLK